MWQQVELALSQSAHRALVTLANFLPGVLALLLAVLLLTAIGAGIAALLRRMLVAARFDERLARNPAIPLSDWTLLPQPHIARRPSRLLGLRRPRLPHRHHRLRRRLLEGNSQMAIFLFPYLTHSVGAILLLIAGNIVARFLARSVLIGAVNAKLQYARFLSLGVKWLVLVLTAAMVLDHLQIGGTVVDLAFGILFGGIVLTLSLAVGLGSRDIVSRSLEKNTPIDTFPRRPRLQTAHRNPPPLLTIDRAEKQPGAPS